jgi:hypothetical protein
MSIPSILVPIALGAFVVAEATGLAQLLGVRGGFARPVHQYADLVLLVAGLAIAWIHREALVAHLKSGFAKFAVFVGVLLAVGAIASSVFLPHAAGPRGHHGGPGFGPGEPGEPGEGGPSGDFEPRQGGSEGRAEGGGPGGEPPAP